MFSAANENDTMHIPIPRCDKSLDFDCNGSRVIPFSRSIFSKESGLGGAKVPINGLTTWLDGSMVYGSTSEEMKKLRSFKDGKMKFEDDISRLLPSGKRVDVSKNNLLKDGTDKNISNVTM